MNPERVLVHADHIRALVLEGSVIPTTRIPPRAAFRGNTRRRKAWLDQASIKLAREPRPFGED